MTERFSRRRTFVLISSFAIAGAGGLAFADDVHTTGVPVLNSRPGAAYTIYLDPAGFNYTGQWSTFELALPGSTPSLNLNGEADNIATFTTTDQNDIKAIWARVAQSYIPFNVNVTTVDPAVAAGQSGTDALRQAYYDAQVNIMHTVIGTQVRAGGGKWYSNSADGVSGLAVVSEVGSTETGGSGGDSPPEKSHTNWMFTEAVAAGGGDYIGAITSHENGHAFGLHHQSDYTGAILVNEYSDGDKPANTGNGSYVAIMGAASETQRVNWRSGDSNTGDPAHTQNDIATMFTTNAALHFVNDGIGHTRGAATPLPLTGSTVNFNLATGVITSASEADPLASGVSNYTTDWFSFVSDGIHAVTLTCNDSTDFLNPGTADGVGTLRSTLSIYNSIGAVSPVVTATEHASTLFETYSGTLPAGTYYADVASFGGHAQDAVAFNDATYFDSGAFFLTGSGFVTAVPEPTAFALVAIAALGMLARRRRMPA